MNFYYVTGTVLNIKKQNKMGYLKTLSRDDLFWFIAPHSIFSEFFFLVCTFPDISTSLKKLMSFVV